MKSLLPCIFISITHLPSANYTSFGIINKNGWVAIPAYLLDLEYGIIYNRGHIVRNREIIAECESTFLSAKYCLCYHRGQFITAISRFTSVIMLVFICAEDLQNESVMGNYAYGESDFFLVLNASLL